MRPDTKQSYRESITRRLVCLIIVLGYLAQVQSGLGVCVCVCAAVCVSVIVSDLMSVQCDNMLFVCCDFVSVTALADVCVCDIASPVRPGLSLHFTLCRPCVNPLPTAHYRTSLAGARLARTPNHYSNTWRVGAHSHACVLITLSSEITE